MSDFLTVTEKALLKSKHKRSDRRTADKIKAILMLDSDYSFDFIAEVLLLDETTIRRWHETYKTGGIDRLLADNYTGGLSYLAIEEIKKLETHLENNVYLTAKEICKLVEKSFSVKYTVKGMIELLHRMEFTYKKPKHIPGKADIEKQKKFLHLCFKQFCRYKMSALVKNYEYG